MIRRTVIALLALWVSNLAAPAKPRVASINMCTDQLVLALADPEQIVGVSHLAHEPSLSFYWQRAKGQRTLSGKAEDVLPLKPDLVLTATFIRSHTRGLLVLQGLAVAEFASAATVADVRAQILRAGELLDQMPRAIAAVDRIDAALAALKVAAAARPLRVLPLERRGWISGHESLITSILTEAGLVNIGSETVGGGGRLPLESIVTLKPDALLLSNVRHRAEDQGTALLQHPALHTALAGRPRLVLDDALTVCAGPMLADALELLARQLVLLR